MTGSWELTWCPECHAPAEVEWRTSLASTDGPVEHVKIACVRRHRFLMPAARFAAPPALRPPAPDLDQALDLEFAYTTWSDSCADRHSPQRECRRPRGHAGPHASGFGTQRLTWR